MPVQHANAAQVSLYRLHDNEIDPLVNGSFQHLRFAPDSYTLTVKSTDLVSDSKVTIAVQAAKTVFFRDEFPTGIWMNLMFLDPIHRSKR